MDTLFGTSVEFGKVDERTIFIPGSTPSSKNSKIIITVKTKDGRSFHSLIDSKQTQQWKKDIIVPMVLTMDVFQKMKKDLSLEYPLNIEFTFVRNSKHDFDYINPCQAIQDQMVEHEWIPDDSTKYIKPSYGDPLYSKDTPGVLIKFL